MAATVAEVMVSILKASGVRQVYGIPGDSLNGFTDAMRRDGGITWQHVRHEEAAAFAAAGEAALTGELAVCAGSCGPGNLHLINGLFDANRSRVPVLAIAAHIPRVEIGGGYFQETHPQELFRECSVYCELVSVPEQLPRVLEIAMRTALQRRRGRGGRRPRRGVPRPSAGRLQARAGARRAVSRPAGRRIAGGRRRVLNDAERVTILAGAGCAGAHDQLIALAVGAEGAGRPRVPRQGVRRVRQPLRRRHDRADRVQLRLPRHGALRRAVHARHRLPVPGISSPRTSPSSRSTSAASRSAAAWRSSTRWWAPSRTRSTRCCRCSRSRPIRRTWTR